MMKGSMVVDLAENPSCVLESEAKSIESVDIRSALIRD